MTSKSILAKSFWGWLPLAAGIVVVGGLAYLAVQQNYRSLADDPQVQLAEDYSFNFEKGNAAPEQVVPAQPTMEIDSTIAPFMIVYDATGTPIGGSVSVDNKLPTLPSGVFDAVKKAKNGEDRFTWQPKTGMRYAVVVKKFGGKEPGFAMLGRSLRETEIRIGNLNIMAIIALALALVLSFLLTWWKERMLSEQAPEKPQSV